MSEKRYEDLMERRAILFAEWMRRVEAAKEESGRGIPSFYGAGVILLNDGSLRMTAFDRESGRSLWDLVIEPFSTEVKVTEARKGQL